MTGLPCVSWLPFGREPNAQVGLLVRAAAAAPLGDGLLAAMLDKLGLVDVFHTLNPHPDQHTWWNNRGQAWANDGGWRLDYHPATPGVAALARRESIYLDQRFSDHALLIIDYDFKL